MHQSIPASPIKSLGIASGLANAQPLGSTKLANAPPPGLTRRANASKRSCGHKRPNISIEADFKFKDDL